ncbi:hypothetical protein CTI12_AA406700 [Artemisia annua]|uniref:Retrotransposon Copia-like N-terminal domain-containing protein n=1 Tax=Artemisia annua TaxID=35608 RepID=A0A2U1M8M3_ARTAN|nr:hypothetical protein CTI12_AA406700 [Artemisia annua]
MDSSKPLYVYPSHGPGSLPIHEKLVGAQNYHSWHGAKEIWFSTKRKLGFVKGTIPRPPTIPVPPVTSVVIDVNIEMWETYNNLCFVHQKCWGKKCSICGFKWHPPDKCWEKVGYPVWHHKYKAQGKHNQSQSRFKYLEKGRGNGSNVNHRRTATSVSSGSNSFTFTSEQFENLIRSVLKDIKPGATTGDYINDELEFVAGMIALNAATNNALFYWIFRYWSHRSHDTIL